MEQYTVTGMSCAACSSRVEKAVSKVPGVTSCSVSLLTNSMGVEGTATSVQIIEAVENAGYGASLKGAANEKTGSAAGNNDDFLKDRDTPVLKRRLIAFCCVSLLPLMYLSMGHMMWNWPLPAFMAGQSCGNGTGTDASDYRLLWSSIRSSLSADLKACCIKRRIWTRW